MYICIKKKDMSTKYKKQGKTGLFDKEFAKEKLSKLGNPLEKLHKVIDFEMFRPELEENMLNHAKTNNAGQKPYDVVLMFKIVLLKRNYNLSDEQAEYQIIDRQSFKEFLRLSSGDKVPDARWTEKGGAKFYGYKDHVKISNGYKLIDTYEVTSAAVHDSQPTEKLLCAEDAGQKLFADSAYIGKLIDKMLKERNITPQIIVKSKTRSRVEHIFGFVTQSMHDFFSRSIGFNRIKGGIGLIHLFYNMFRYEQIVRLKLQTVTAK
ncbi:hypothetical protein FACS1894201_10690 [Bacteroidia bacterium]|nr:hypothetical protein FACS1894201_10690 [Bacteroidia bacterium]